MNPYYKQPVVIFGLVAPLVVIAILLGIGFRYKGKLENTYTKRKADYAKYQQTRKVRAGLEKTISKHRPVLQKWMELFDTPTATKVNGILGEVQKRFPGEEFQQTSFRRANSTGGIGAASAQSSVQLDLKFRGTYRGLQNAFLELETQMPHLQLDTMKIKQETNRQVLTADLVYTAWQKE